MKKAVQIDNQEQLNKYIEWANNKKSLSADYALNKKWHFPKGFEVDSHDFDAHYAPVEWYILNDYEVLSFSEFEKEYLKETFEYGELVEVSNNERDWKRRLFVSTMPGNAILPYAAVDLLGEEDFKKGRHYTHSNYRFIRKIQKPKWKPIIINDVYENHSAVIKENELVIGCQHISFELAHKIHDAILKAEQFKKDNP